MAKKIIYVRDGRRFKRVEDRVGWFWDGNQLTKKNNSLCVGIVVDQHGDELTVASLRRTAKVMTWSKAINHCRALHGYLPSRADILNAIDRFGEYLLKDSRSDEWTSTEYAGRFAWCLRWYSSEHVGLSLKSCSRCVRPFYKITLP